MKTKIFYGNQYISSFKCTGKYLTTWQRIKLYTRIITKKVLLVGLIGTSIFSAYKIGVHFNPQYLYAEVEVKVPVETKAPVLERIAQCESGNMHYKDGQVIINANSNGTVDIGRYQINSVWNKKATELGLNLTNEKDNEAMAQYIYKNFGTEPWYSSKKCWNK